MRLIEVEVLGVKLQAGLLNPKVARKYDEGLGKVLRTVEDAQSCSDGARGIEMMCGAVVDFVDEVFGAGSAKRVLGEETDLLTCLDAWEELTELYEKQVHPILEERNRIVMEKAGRMMV